jgi:hypothetical protein
MTQITEAILREKPYVENRTCGRNGFCARGGER